MPVIVVPHFGHGEINYTYAPFFRLPSWELYSKSNLGCPLQFLVGHHILIYYQDYV